MKTLMACLLLSVAVLGSSVTVGAHDKYRIVGTVAKLASDQIDVKQVKDGQIVEIDLTKNTKVTRDKKIVSVKDIKVGGSVVIDAYGDSILDLEALEIRIVPAIAPTPKPK